MKVDDAKDTAGKVGTYIIAVIIVFGALKSFFLGILLPTIFRTPPWITDPAGLTVNWIVHGPLVAGWLYFVFSGKSLKRRGQWSWLIPIGGAMIAIGCFLPIVERVFFHGSPEYLRNFVNEMYYLSETPLYALGYGLAIMLYKFEDEKKLLLFHIPLAGLWAIGPLIPGSLMYHLGLAFQDIVVEGDITCVIGPETNGMPIWIFPQCLYDVWFWADQVTDYPLAYIVIGGLVKGYLWRRKR